MVSCILDDDGELMVEPTYRELGKRFQECPKKFGKTFFLIWEMVQENYFGKIDSVDRYL